MKKTLSLLTTGILIGILVMCIFAIVVVGSSGLCKIFGGEPNYGSSSCYELKNGSEICTKDLVYKGCSIDLSIKLKTLFD